MADLKLVLGMKDGKTYQRELKGAEAESLHGKRIGETISGDIIGLSGYEFLITGGSDKCGFPMRKGIQYARKRVLMGESVGFCGKKRPLRKKSTRTTQKGLVKRRTVCGERITSIIHQVNMKVLKEGSQPLAEAPAQTEEQSNETSSKESNTSAPKEK